MSSFIQKELEKNISLLIPTRWSLTDDPAAEAAIGFENLKKNDEVQKFIKDFIEGKKKVYFVHSGRRSFKSELSKRMLVRYALTHRKEVLLYCAPTSRQVSDIAWTDLKDMIPKIFIDRIQENDMIITLKNSTKIKLYSLDTPERIEGQKIDGIVLDEFADAKDNTWFQSVLPAISDKTSAWAIVISTPGGRTGDFYKIWEAVRSQPDKFLNYGLYHWHRGELLGAEWLEQYKSQVDKRSFEQEWLGNFVSGQGQAYLYDSSKHLNENINFNPLLPIDISCDFNVGIMPWVASQSTQDMTVVLDEITGRECTIEHMCNLVKSRVTNMLGDRGKVQRHLLRFYGDASAQYIRDPSAHQASWSIMKQQFNDWNAEFKLTRQNPRIGDRIALTNARLMTADGKVHCKISPRCRELILDFEGISYEDIMQGQKTKLGNERSHASDAFGYYCWHMFKTDFRRGNITNIPI